MPNRFFGGHHVKVAFAVLILILSVGLVACGEAAPETQTTAAAGTAPPETQTTAAAGEPRQLMVSAASSLKNAFIDIGIAFDLANNSETSFNFDSSGALQKQIEGGAPVDVFASAAPTQIENLLRQGLVDEASIAVFAGNTIVVAVPAGSTLEIARFEDLAKPEVERVAYGDPAAAPHGVYAEEVMTTLSVLEQIRPKVVYTKNASQTLTYVTSGEVDAGIMYSTDAIAGGDGVRVVATSQADWHSPILYPIAIVSASAAKPLAQAFIDFVMSDQGRALLEKHGFAPAPAG